jgi:hypothetical protein
VGDSGVSHFSRWVTLSSVTFRRRGFDLWSLLAPGDSAARHPFAGGDSAVEHLLRQGTHSLVTFGGRAFWPWSLLAPLPFCLK